MKRFMTALAIASALLSACANIPAGAPPLSPREKAQQVDLAWAAVQAAVETAVTSPLLAAKPDVKAELKAASDAASAAVLAYHDAAANCLRDLATGQLGNAPGKTCDMSTITIAAAEAQTLVDQASALVSAFGFKPAPVASNG